jgi:hypothetical protein
MVQVVECLLFKYKAKFKPQPPPPKKYSMIQIQSVKQSRVSNSSTKHLLGYFKNLEYKYQLGMVAHTCTPSTQKRSRKITEFEARRTLSQN